MSLLQPVRVIVLAKAPQPGRVKTRLCPPFTPHEAAQLASAALADTLDTVTSLPAAHAALVIEGPASALSRNLTVLPQRGGGLDERVAAAFADTAIRGMPSLLVGMDTPQLVPRHLENAVHVLDDGADAVLGPALDGGWWLLGLRDPYDAEALRGVPMSTSQTGRLTVAALSARGLRVESTATLRDVDTAADAHAVAREAPRTRFAATVSALEPAA
jgi:uncharacterized protein